MIKRDGLPPRRRLTLALMALFAPLSCDFFDIFPPEIEIISPEEGVSYFGTFPCEIKASDNRKVTKVEVFLDGESIHEFTKSPYQTTLSLAGVSNPANLRAVAHDKAGNYAEAESQVSISLGFKLISPNGGETWPEQSNQTIAWESSGNVGSTVSLQYSVDGGNTWDEITGSTANNGTYPWTLPNFSETQSACKIKVSTDQYEDESDDVFSINAEPNALTLTSPNGGETWQEQSTKTITWTKSGDVGDYVSLHYSLDGVVNWNQIIDSTVNDGSHSWTLPNLSETKMACRVSVNSTSTSFADTSDANFTITGGEITLTSPNGGEDWREWSTQTITWGYSGDVGTYFSLHYSIDGGLSWSEIESSTLNDGLYEWTLPTIGQTETACKVKVTSPSTSQFDISDGYFTITNWEPVLVGTYDTPGHARGVSVSGSYAYVADGGSGLQVINVSNAGSPTLAGTYNTPGDAWSVYVSGTYSYVADGGSGLHIINVSNPASPTLAGNYDLPNPALDVFVSGSYAYVANDGSGLQVINVADPASPTLAGSYNTPGPAFGVFVSGSYACVADYGGGLKIINVSNPASPTLAGSYNTPGIALGVFVSGSYAYVADYGSGLQIINVANPASPSLAGSCDTPGIAWGVFVSGGYAYVTWSQVSLLMGGLQIIDISNPSSPTLASEYGLLSRPYGVFVSGNHAYVANADNGLLIFDISGLDR